MAKMQLKTASPIAMAMSERCRRIHVLLTSREARLIGPALPVVKLETSKNRASSALERCRPCVGLPFGFLRCARAQAGVGQMPLVRIRAVGGVGPDIAGRVPLVEQHRRESAHLLSSCRTRDTKPRIARCRPQWRCRARIRPR